MQPIYGGMTSDQIVNLRVGQKVRCTHFKNRYYEISKIILPAEGERVIVLEDKIFVGASQIEDVL